MATAATPLPVRLRPTLRAALGPALLGLAAFAFLAAFVAHDPAPGVTASASPFTDEAYNILEPRNLVLLGTWTTDDWALYLVHLPYSLLLAATFALFGVGMVQARLVSIALVGLTTAILAGGLGRPLGRGPAAIAAVAYAGCALVLYYGRLAFLEDLVVPGLVAGCLLIARDDGRPSRVGLLAGLALGLAIGTKPNAAVAAVGLAGGVLLAGGWRDPGVRRRLAAAATVVAALGLGWLVLVAIPNARGVQLDVGTIWPQVRPPTGIRSLLANWRYFLGTTDQLPTLAGPVGLAAILSVVVVASRWRWLAAEQRRLVGGAMGWALVSVVFLISFQYHPNRYAIHIVPALAILVGVGASAARAWWAGRARRPTSRGGRVPLAIGALVAILLVAPGVATEAGWIGATTASLPVMQRSFAAAVPPGSVVVGPYSPFVLLTAPVTTVVRWDPNVNAGDLYVDRGARWYVTTNGQIPPDLGAHPTAWAARQDVVCGSWNAKTVCLYHVP